jgi:hypothetical protein
MGASMYAMSLEDYMQLRMGDQFNVVKALTTKEAKIFGIDNKKKGWYTQNRHMPITDEMMDSLNLIWHEIPYINKNANIKSDYHNPQDNSSTTDDKRSIELINSLLARIEILELQMQGLLTPAAFDQSPPWD